MEEYTLGGINLKLNIGKGCWCLGFDSASGKSYLAQLFRAARASSIHKQNFLVFTYNSSEDADYYIKQLQNFNGKYILFDKFDTYYSEAIMKVALQKNACLLLDLKDSEKWNLYSYKLACIEYTECEMEVFEL